MKRLKILGRVFLPFSQPRMVIFRHRFLSFSDTLPSLNLCSSSVSNRSGDSHKGVRRIELFPVWSEYVKCFKYFMNKIEVILAGRLGKAECEIMTSL